MRSRKSSEVTKDTNIKHAEHMDLILSITEIIHAYRLYDNIQRDTEKGR